MMRSILILMCCVSLTGCQQAKSFMHMNSDSPSPFFGLQLAVDAESPSVQIPSLMEPTDNRSADSADMPSHSQVNANTVSNVHLLTSATTPSRRGADFRFTASENAMNGDLRMALPKSKPKSGSHEADQLADLLHRLKRS